jgi:plasmid replication initiation protein
MEEKKQDITLYQANPLTESRYEFSPTEKNAFYMVIRQVRKNYVEREPPRTEFENMKVQITTSDLVQITDKDHTERARKALRALRDKAIEFEDEEGNWLYCGFINQARWVAKKQVYEVEVSSDLMPYLVQLASQYTEYSLLVAMSLKGKHSQRFYELCSQYKNRGIFGKTVQQLKEMFMLDGKYPQLYLFKQKVIDAAQKEIKSFYDNGQCDLWFDYVQDGKADDAHFTFYVHTKEEEKRKKAQKNAPAWDDMFKQKRGIITILRAIIKNDKKYIERVDKQLDLQTEDITPIYNKLLSLTTDFKGADLAKLTRWILSTDYGIK